MGIGSFFQRIFSPKEDAEKRSSANVDNPIYWQNLFSSINPTATGQVVTPESAMRSSAVFACVRVLAETVASLPLFIYKRKKDGGREVADMHNLFFLLHDMPNPVQTSFEFREMIMTHLCLRGNAFSYIEWNESGEINALYPLNPARMTVRKLDKERIIYEYLDDNGKTWIYPQEVMWHIKGLTSDGLTGLSPISMAREAIGLSLSAEDYGARFFGNYAKPGGILEYPGKLSEDAYEKLKKSWESAYTGANAHRMAILEGGLTYKQVGMNNDDAQFLELRQFQIEDISRIFRVPGILIGYSGDKLNTYASAEQMMLSFITHTIRPWTGRIEQSITKDLFRGQLERKRYFAEFNLADFVRGDLAARYQAFRVGREGGWLSINDVRKLDNMNPIDDPMADEYMMPRNMVFISKIDEELAMKQNGGNNANPETEPVGE